jgi:hypothetical protein
LRSARGAGSSLIVELFDEDGVDRVDDGVELSAGGVTVVVLLGVVVVLGDIGCVVVVVVVELSAGAVWVDGVDGVIVVDGGVVCCSCVGPEVLDGLVESLPVD